MISRLSTHGLFKHCNLSSNIGNTMSLGLYRTPFATANVLRPGLRTAPAPLSPATPPRVASPGPSSLYALSPAFLAALADKVNKPTTLPKSNPNDSERDPQAPTVNMSRATVTHQVRHRGLERLSFFGVVVCLVKFKWIILSLLQKRLIGASAFCPVINSPISY